MHIISYIRESGKTVADVCREAGITRATFYSAIKPGSNPGVKTLEAIAQATGLTVEQVRKGAVE
jgi:DNA-binding phage protein